MRTLRLLGPGLLLASSALAQDAQEIVVIGVAPADAGLELGKIPYPVQTADAEDLANAAAVSLADFMRAAFGSVSLNDAQNNPLQPDLQYRGFTVSPLLGLAQGMAVYQNGVRINEPLGDTVNWDLLPQSAIDNIALTGGATPLFGLNSLGGSMVVNMKDGFGHEGFRADLSAGSFGRSRASFEFGGNDGSLGYYLNVEDFREDGWRDSSESDAFNVYGTLGWRGDLGQVNLNYQRGESELIGNGSSPVELLAINRAAIFTGPDITAHDMDMLSLDFSTEISDNSSISGAVFLRRNDTHSFNGDASEFEIEDLEEEELSGTGILSDAAINNLSDRSQETRGADFQWTANTNLFGYDSRVVLGAAWHRGESDFDSVVELADIDPHSRLTTGLGTGTFVDEEATLIHTETESTSIYFTTTTDLSETLALTISARSNNTDANLRDLSGERPELNGNHSFSRVNPAVGLTWQASENHNFYASLGESNRAPTPIELACNEYVYDLAVEYAIADGEEADDVEFECRLPNAFLADPPLEDVVARNMELGARGMLDENTSYGLSLFRTDNENDILFQTTGRATGLFANVDRTRREGIEGRLAGNLGELNWFTAYSYISATFEDDFQVLSPNHDFADEEGEITVLAGDSIPGIPAHQFKFGADYAFDEDLILSLDLIANSGQYLRGDESNELDEIDGYTLVNLGARYRVNDRLLVYAQIHNLFDSKFETFGLLGEEPGEVEVPLVEDFEIPIFLGAAPPRAGFLGLRYRF
ncbi:MAG: TonB-dependent receptor [Gammaproteobacteria bacterium]|nr:TonB-dependent receptor [Gammaproteobacteria bacterium]MYE29763.1 TonB-dependent receptor [Gammaproteobacteria bacterium]MYI01742.1 TonB-dependent receptor [Gammaproteobacteria bacterium]